MIENPKRLIRNIIATLAGGLLYDSFKSSIIASGIGVLLPDFAFLVKPIMVVLRVSLGAFVIHNFIEDSVNRRNKRKAAKEQEKIQRHRDNEARIAAEKKQKAERLARVQKSIVGKFDWLIQTHDQIYFIGAEGQKTIEKASLFVDSLAQLGLIHPSYVKGAKNIKDNPSQSAIKHICAVRECLEQTGYKEAKKLVEEWEVSTKRTPSRIDTSND